MAREALPSDKPPPAADPLTIREVLRRFAIDSAQARIDQPPHIQGFSGAIIRRIAVAGGDDPTPDSAAYCLRCWPRPGLPQQRLIELHRFLRFVHDEGIRVVAVPIPTASGGTLVTHRGRDWQLEPWMPGAADFKHAPGDGRLNNVMDTLARFHQAAARYRPTAAGREWFAERFTAPSPAVRERLALVEHWTDAQLQRAAQSMSREPDSRFGDLAREIIDRFRSMRGRIRAELLEMRDVPVPLQVCLRDVWHDHVLFTGDDVTGLVDPSAARTESVAADLSRLLGSLLGPRSDRWERALRRYCQTRTLSESEYRLIGVLHLSGTVLSGMTWIERRLRDEISCEIMPAIVARLEDFQRQLRG